MPVDGFWSLTVYNREGYLQPNPYQAYALNSLTAQKGPDGAIKIQFGGCDGKTPNCLPITKTETANLVLSLRDLCTLVVRDLDHCYLRNNAVITSKDLTKEAPRSLCQRVKGYAVLARMVDKGRATINGTMGEYHFNCPLDNMLFSFKGVQAEDVKNVLASGATDEQVAAWLDQNGIPKTADEIKVWSDSVEAIQPYQDPEDRDWFVSECARLGIDPVKSRLCDYLDTDDRLSFPK